MHAANAEGPRRVVVYTGGADGLELPAARPAARAWIPGGMRTLHEFAFAAAAGGRPVELRGPVLPAAFESLAAAGATRPQLPQAPRRATARDIVVISEGDTDPLCAGRAVLSAARVVLLVLAPPGLFGWPYTPGWSAASPHDVARESLARPEHFRAAAALGMSVWTHMTRVRELSEAAGVACHFIGNGSPLAGGDPVRKTVDVAWVRTNRWAPWAEQVAAGLAPELVVDAIEEVEHEQLIRRLAAARILLWPSKGHARIPTEARAVGCVPVALSHNDFASGLDAPSGAVVVDQLGAMGEAVQTLLRRPGELASRAQRSAREQLDWPAYVARVQEGLAAVDAAEPVSGGAPAVIGDRFADLLAAEAARSGRLEQREGELRAQLEELGRAHDAARAQLASLRGRRAVRLALRAAAAVRGRR